MVTIADYRVLLLFWSNYLMWLISFDIDGTMEFGDPPGILTKEIVSYFRDRGAVVDSASDRPVSAQWSMWKQYGVELDFAILKHHMKTLRDKYPDFSSYWHVGDRPLDQQNAKEAEFTFFWPDQFPTIELGNKVFPDLQEISSMKQIDKAIFVNNALHSLAGGALSETDDIDDRSENINEGAGRLPGDLGGF